MQHAAPSLIQEQFLFLNQLNSFYCIVELVYVYTTLSFLFIIYLFIYTHSVKLRVLHKTCEHTWMWKTGGRSL